MKAALLALVSVAFVVASGCQRYPADAAAQGSIERADARDDVAEAVDEPAAAFDETDEALVDAERARDIAADDAQENMRSATGGILAETAVATYSRAMTDAAARARMAMEKCEAFDGVDRTTCLSEIDAARAVEETRAIADRDSALALAKRQD